MFVKMSFHPKIRLIPIKIVRIQTMLGNDRTLIRVLSNMLYFGF